MKIAVIGSNSLLASYIIDELIAQDSTRLLHLFGKSGLSAEQATFTYFAYPESVLAFSDLLTCDAIVYCAATGVQANKATDTALVYEINAF
ncbi:MAG: hypothetical protein EOO55_02485, partial [Hymenobacter sp.]